jgi:Ca2+-binding RTX toxin-like protein
VTVLALSGTYVSIRTPVPLLFSSTSDRRNGLSSRKRRFPLPSNGEDSLFGRDGMDRIARQVGSDSMTGGDGRDRLTGNLGADTLFGNNKADIMRGN